MEKESTISFSKIDTNKVLNLLVGVLLQNVVLVHLLLIVVEVLRLRLGGTTTTGLLEISTGSVKWRLKRTHFVRLWCLLASAPRSALLGNEDVRQ